MSPIDLDAAPLVDLNTGAKLCGADLFKEPVFVVAFRRPGCMLCRDEALKMIRLKSTLRDIGVGLVGLLHEDLDEQARSCPITYSACRHFLPTQVLYRLCHQQAMLCTKQRSYSDTCPALTWACLSEAKKGEKCPFFS